MLNSLTLSQSAPPQALLEARRPALTRLAQRLVWNEDDARDVVQSAYVDALSRWHTLYDIAAVEGWLRRIVVNRAMSLLRRRKFWKGVATVLMAEEEFSPAPDEASDQRGHQVRLSRELERLSARQATAFSLRYLEGLSIDEVAAALGVDRGTTRVHLQRAVKHLRLAGVLP